MYTKSNFFLFVLLTIFIAISCKEPCDTIVCQNDGVCMTGECDCPVGYEGDLCELIIRDKILGSFTVSSDCIGGTANTNEWAVLALSGTSTGILINNFHEPALNLQVTIVDSVSLEIMEQFTDGYTISGTGTFNDEGGLELEYTIIREANQETVTCTAIATRN